MTGHKALGNTLKFTVLAATIGLLAACDGATVPAFLRGGGGNGSDAAPLAQAGGTRLVERDVEAPEVFQKTENGLWDGRPSLGGVWVAHPDVTDPERVIIRNQANGKFVIGALFRRERAVPGPRFQVSSDAAEALGMLAGAPGELNVTALRREEAPEPAPQGDETLPAPDAIEASSLDPIEAAAAALDEAEGLASTPAPTPAAAPAPSPASGLAKPYIQIGIFSVETNASNTAQSLRSAGLVPTIVPGASSGKKFWRVIVGPVGTASDRAAILKKVKGLGFSDAYFVTN